MRAFAAFVATVWLAVSGSAFAGDRAVVVELYTSQGCSSCPPADKILGELANRDDVIALAFHVDYWDYIGWKDQFASPAHTARQRAYAAAKGERTIYTPQMVIGGVDHVIGTRPMKLADAIQKHKAVRLPVSLTLVRRGADLRITAEAQRPLEGNVVVQLVKFTPSESVAIRRGENAGRTLTYHNIVSELKQIDEWDGRGSWTGTVRSVGDTPVAVIIQHKGHGPVVAAAQLR